MTKTKKVNFLPSILLLIYILVCAVYVFPAFEKSKQFKDEDTQKVMLEMWHIECFEGGSFSRKTFLERQMRAYEQMHKGLYVHISTYTYEQALDLLRKGEKFDLISFGGAVGSSFLSHLAPFPPLPQLNAVNKQLVEAGQLEGESYAIPYLLGGYCLVARESDVADSHLEQTALQSFGVGNYYVLQKNEVSQNVFLTHLKNKNTAIKAEINERKNGTGNVLQRFSQIFQRDIFGVVAEDRQKKADLERLVGNGFGCVYGFGTNNLPFLALNAVVGGNFENFSCRDTQYQAYKSFLDKEAKILLGTQRDVCKLNNRMSGGSIENLVFQPLAPYTDLVQYISVSHSTAFFDKCVDAAYFLIDQQCQQNIKSLEMLSVLNTGIYSQADGAIYFMEKAFLKKIVTLHAFCDSQQVKSFRQQSAKYLSGEQKPIFLIE